MKKFEDPTIEILRFEMIDAITSSTLIDENEGEEDVFYF